MQNALNNPDTFNGMSPQEADTQRTSLQQQIAGMQMTSATLQQTAVNLTARQQQAIPDVQVAIANRPAYEAEFNTAEADYNAASTNTAQLSEPIQQFDEATQIIDEMNTRIQKRDDEISNWDDNHQDKYRELMAYWDRASIFVASWQCVKKTKEIWPKIWRIIPAIFEQVSVCAITHLLFWVFYDIIRYMTTPPIGGVFC